MMMNVSHGRTKANTSTDWHSQVVAAKSNHRCIQAGLTQDKQGLEIAVNANSIILSCICSCMGDINRALELKIVERP
eukprot:scaffold226664_cov12-Prasinocladus_malaysianus.AAC.1